MMDHHGNTLWEHKVDMATPVSFYRMEIESHKKTHPAVPVYQYVAEIWSYFSDLIDRNRLADMYDFMVGDERK